MFFAVTVTCLILQQRYGRKYNDYQSVGVEDDEAESDRDVIRPPTDENSRLNNTVRDIEDFGSVLRRNGKLNFFF